MTLIIHPLADVSPDARIGDGTRIWHHAQIRENAQLGENCVISKGVYIDAGVSIGNNVKIQNYVSVFHGVTIEDGVFVGPHVCFTNDLMPRAINADGSLKSQDDWVLSETHVGYGAALGANSTIRCGISIGRWVIVGAGSVITKSIPDNGLVYGNPARLHGFVCSCGHRVEKKTQKEDAIIAYCSNCGEELQIPIKNWEMLND